MTAAPAAASVTRPSIAGKPSRLPAGNRQPPSAWPGPPGPSYASSGGIGEGSRWCGLRQSGRAQYTDPAETRSVRGPGGRAGRRRRVARDPAGPARRPCHKVTPRRGPAPVTGRAAPRIPRHGYADSSAGPGRADGSLPVRNCTSRGRREYWRWLLHIHRPGDGADRPLTCGQRT